MPPDITKITKINLEYIENLIGRVPAGFRLRFSCADYINTLKGVVIVENVQNLNPRFICFLSISGRFSTA